MTKSRREKLAGADVAPYEGAELAPHFSAELTEDARVLLGQRLGRELTTEEARQMLVRLTTYFETLIQWDREDKRKKAEQEANKPDTESATS